MNNSIEIKPIHTKEYNVKQSKFAHIGLKLPTRSVILGPSGSGKTVLLQNMIMNIYRGCFERIYIFSPSVNVDSTWQPVKDYISNQMNVHETDTDKYYFDHYDQDALEGIISTQNKIVKHLKAKNKKNLFQILIIIDDFADDSQLSRHSKLLHSLYTRGRHAMISTITATQKFASIAPIIRVNATELFVYRLRNHSDLDKFVDEISAAIDKKTLLKIYKECTSEPYSFLYANLMSNTVHDMFFCNLNQKIVFDKTT
jgi:archaellum biogenesis ATPase FlaH